jgi:hypothetical protein
MRNVLFLLGVAGLLLGSTIFFYGCASQPQKAKQSTEKQEDTMKPYEKVALEKFGKDAKLAVTPNTEGGNYLLCQTEKTRNGQQWSAFFLFDQKAEEVLLEDLNLLGSVDWKDAENLRVRYTGNVENTSLKGFTFNLKTKKKTFQVPNVSK